MAFTEYEHKPILFQAAKSVKSDLNITKHQSIDYCRKGGSNILEFFKCTNTILNGSLT